MLNISYEKLITKNDVGTSLFIREETYKKIGKMKEARAVYEKSVNDYFYAQSGDSQDGFGSRQKRLGKLLTC